jgi:hypothetical protein
MDKYLSDLEVNKANETETAYREQLENYDEFVRSLITTNRILTRYFYIVIPYTATGKVDFDGIKEQLSLKVDIVQKGLTRLGMSSNELSDLEVLDLFYSFYSPEQAKLQPLSAKALELLHNEYIQGRSRQ